MATNLPVDEQLVRNAVQKQIDEHGMDNLTSRMIRSNLQALFNVDFIDYKVTIDKITMDIVEQNAQKQSKVSNDESKSDSDSEDGTVFTDKVTTKKHKSATKRQASDSESELLEVGQKRRRASRKCAPKKKVKSVDSQPKPRRKGAYGGYCALTEDLASLVGKQYMRRCDVIKTMWVYFRSNNLLDPKDKRYVLADERLAKLVKRRRFLAFGVMKDLSSHIIDPKLLDEEERAALKKYEAEMNNEAEGSES